ncbi:probable BRE4 Protein involved in endocytosis [Phialocephala subalpina]|uniref:Probable BRE4 Protein involved in endocytosis n=1 Tax=Phialocephala subalpina TaxID=576137 RepID=A0A1L7X7J3_9HELO|nr:probable BRE4 Protein involved in endocytosis [Phialocephala subalpina]
MSSSKDNTDGDTPHLLFTAPSFGPTHQTSALNPHNHGSRLHRRRKSQSGHHEEKRIRLQPPLGEPRSSASSIYRGSYSHSPRRSRSLRTESSAPASPRMSMSDTHLEDLLENLQLDLETYGLEETRDGFFDASFLKPNKVDHDDLMRDAECTLPAAFKKTNPLSPKAFFPKQWREIKGVIRAVTTTRAGIKLTKSFLAFFIAYILCLVPVIVRWLGRYSYIMVLSTIINHPGRTIGAQIDGAFLTIMGTATGLGWGAFALWLSDSTSIARRGYGGILATFLLLFMGTIAALRSYYIRMYQFVLAAGIAISYTVLADTSEAIAWHKLFDYGIPWLFGQVICLLVCCAVVPDAGARLLAVSLHDAFRVMQDGLIIPHPDSRTLHRNLAWTFVNLSQAYRDLVLDISITRFKPSDMMALRNIMQAVIRSFLSLKMQTQLFDDFDEPEDGQTKNGEPAKDTSEKGDKPSGNGKARVDVAEDAIIDIDTSRKRPSIFRTGSEERAVKLIAGRLANPTSKLLSCMSSSLASCDAVLLEMSGHRKYLGPPKDVSDDILGALTKIRKAMIKYDEAEELLMQSPDLPPTYSNHPEVVELFLFVHPVRLGATSVEALLVKVNEMQQRRPGWRLYLPSYPFGKALQRTNAQVRHDRGGVTAGYYFRSQTQLARTMKGMANTYKPLPRHQDPQAKVEEDHIASLGRADTIGKYEEEEDIAMDRNSQATKKQRFRYKLWVVLHRLQGFETRFALKVAITTSLLSVPAWLHQSRGWWNENESWWAVVMVWVMSHPRVGGNLQDLVTRALCGVLGAVWGGIAYGVREGNPYVMAALAAIYMIPMIYRFTQSGHPRSGIVGCFSFIVVSLGAKAADGLPSVVQISWTRGLAIVVGTVAAVIVNWILWPFVARHELRKALSAMLIYSSIIYRGVVAKYVYYEKGEEPGKEDIERSEMLEGRLREGFVRIRQILVISLVSSIPSSSLAKTFPQGLTRHEIRLRGPFNPLPYSGLIDACERFFEYLVAVRQSSLFFHPHYISDSEQAAESLLSYRRDAVATILMNLYVLAGALRGDRPVPRYLPSAALARKALLDHMALLESQITTTDSASRIISNRKWSQIYSYSYSQSLTGCVQQLELLAKYVKEIVGEQGFDPMDPTVHEELSAEKVRAHGMLDGNASRS